MDSLLELIYSIPDEFTDLITVYNALSGNDKQNEIKDQILESIKHFEIKDQFIMIIYIKKIIIDKILKIDAKLLPINYAITDFKYHMKCLSIKKDLKPEIFKIVKPFIIGLVESRKYYHHEQIPTYYVRDHVKKITDRVSQFLIEKEKHIVVDGVTTFSFDYVCLINVCIMYYFDFATIEMSKYDKIFNEVIDSFNSEVFLTEILEDDKFSCTNCKTAFKKNEKAMVLNKTQTCFCCKDCFTKLKIY